MRRSSLNPFTFAAILLAWSVQLPAPLAAQEPATEQVADTVFESVEVSVVNVEVWVTDRQGKPVTDLRREDFELTVDGRQTPIANFYAETSDRPLPEAAAAEAGTRQELTALDVPEDQRVKIVVFIDNTHLRPANRKKVFRALREFLDTNMAAGDSVMVAAFNPGLRIYSEFITDRRALAAILDEAQDSSGPDLSGELERRRVFNELSRTAVIGTGGSAADALANPGSLLATIRAYAQTEYDRARTSLDVVAAFTETLAGVPGRKALLLVSDGIPTNPGEEMFLAFQETFFNNAGVRTEALGSGAYTEEIGNFDLLPAFRDLARRANSVQVTFYPIDAEGDGPGRIRSASLEGGVASQALSVAENNYREPMELVAGRTGGRRLTARPQLATDLAKLGVDFGNFYSLGFESRVADADSPLRIDVEVNRPGVVVRHREDYLPRSRDTRSADATMAALLYGETPNPLRVEVTQGAAQPREDGATLVPLQLSIPVGRLTLIPREGNWDAQVALFVSVREKDGATRPVQKIPFHLSIPDAAIEDARTKPARYGLPFVMQPGDRQVAVTVRDDFGAAQSSMRLDLAAASR